MAVYQIFPTQDATLYSEYPSMNTGLDAILEASNKLTIAGNPEVARYLIKFDSDEIKDVIDNKISNGDYKIYLKNFISEVKGLNQDTLLEILPLAQNWNNGTGYFLDNPKEEDGCSWKYANFSGSGIWQESGSYSGTSGVISATSSYSSSGVGGGSWFVDSLGSLYVLAGYVNPNYVGSVPVSASTNLVYSLRSNKDLIADVSSTVTSQYDGTIPNYGLIVKLTSSLEFNTSSFVQPSFKYYSVDTNTIYPPVLEFRWNDYNTVLTGSLSSNIVSTSDIKLSIAENPGLFHPDSVNRFYVNVSPLYPTRVYQTSSLYTNTNYLPEDSYYAVKDLDTNEFVINFDTTFTRISSDEKGNYFDVYMSGLEPERYYQLLIKTNINNSTLILDDDYYFKVINP